MSIALARRGTIAVSRGVTWTDDFNRADSTNLGANWLELTGNLQIVSNRLGGVANEAEYVVQHEREVNTVNHKASIEVITVPAGSFPGVMCRMNGTTRYQYQVDPATNQHVLRKVVAGVNTNLATLTEALPATPYTMEIEANGTTITARLNGAQKLQVTNGDITTGKKAGLRDGAGRAAIRWDNFSTSDV